MTIKGTMKKRILILTDPAKADVSLSYCLSDKRYRLTCCYSVAEVIDKCSVGTFDLVLVDLDKSIKYLLDVIHHLRRKIHSVLWLFTAQLSALELVTLLKAGADNCLAKTACKNELLMRIEVFFRRRLIDEGKIKNSLLEINGLSLCLSTRELHFRGENIQITAIEFELLQLLMVNFGKVVSRDDIAENIFRRSILYCSKSVNMHISNIRKKLKSLNDDSHIKTVRGSGYVFVSAESML